MDDEKTKQGSAARSKESAAKQPRMEEATAPASESKQTAGMTVVTGNYIFNQKEPEELPDNDPRKGTMSDPNLQDRAWVNRKFIFNLKQP